MSHRRNAARLVALIVSAAAALAVAPASSPAAYIHPTVTASFGADGTSGSSFASINRLGLRSREASGSTCSTAAPPRSTASTLDTGDLHAADGQFPDHRPPAGGDPDIAVDNSGGAQQATSTTCRRSNGGFGFDSAGNALFTISGPTSAILAASPSITKATSRSPTTVPRRSTNFPPRAGASTGILQRLRAGQPVSHRR